MAEYDLQEFEDVFNRRTSETDFDCHAPSESSEIRYGRGRWYIAAPLRDCKEGDRDRIREILSWWFGKERGGGEFCFHGTYFRNCSEVVEWEDLVEVIASLRNGDIDVSFFVLFIDEEDNWALFYYGGLWRPSYYFADVKEGERIFL